jgi:hypothetical protein
LPKEVILVVEHFKSNVAYVSGSVNLIANTISDNSLTPLEIKSHFITYMNIK